MSPSITFSGVDNAISNLNYRNKKALKYKFVKAVRGFYSEEAQFDSISQIEVDELIGLIWETEDPKEIRSKRINFNSIKAAVNTDFKKIYDKGLNFEGLTISPSNTFEMSAEAKDQLLESFVNSIRADGKLDFHKVSQVLNMINAFLESATTSIQEQDTDEVINKIQSILNNISTKVVDTKDGQPILAEDERLIIRPDELIDDEFEYLEDESDENEFDFEGVEDEPEEDDLEFMDSEEDEDEFEIDDEDEFEDLLDEELDFIDEEDEFEDEEIDDDEYEEIEIGEDELEADDEIISEVDDDDE
ncbi:MAG: hypothetical protein GY714_22740, partial [Desulfobacterales bacterium]|nr:hypothetical protein [Desulfobacterales bacterium]